MRSHDGIKKIVATCGLMVSFVSVILLQQCASRDEDIKGRLNPLDPLREETITVRGVSRFLSVDSLWRDYDFIRSKGTLACSIRSDVSYYTLFSGTQRDSLDSLLSGTTAVFNLSDLTYNTIYYFRLQFYSHDGTGIVDSGWFLTPAGTPPVPPGWIHAEGSVYGIQISWDSGDAASAYCISRRGPDENLFLPVTTIDTNVLFDSVKTYGLYTYRVSTCNIHGEAQCTTMAFSQKLIPLNPPYNVEASRGLYPDKIVLSWAPDIEAAAYRITRASFAEGPYTDLGTTNDSLFIDTVTEKGLQFYRVAAMDDSGRFGVSGSTVSGYILDSLPIPAGLSASQGLYPDYISISWYPVPGATAYRVYRSRTSKQFSLLQTTVDTMCFDTVTNAYPWFYTVSAVDSNGIETEMTLAVIGQVTDVPPPLNVEASDSSNPTCIVISWDPIKASVYYIYRSLVFASGYELIDSTKNSVYYDTLTSSTTAYYKVSGRTDWGIESRLSDPDMGSLMLLGTPERVTASRGTYVSHVTVSWKPTPGAKLYNVYWSASQMYNFGLKDSTSDTVFIDTANTHLYGYYKIAAIDGAGNEGNLSSPVLGYSDSLSAPAGLTASRDNPGSILLRWNSVQGADRYIVYKSSQVQSFFSAIDTVSDTGFSDTNVTGSAYYLITALYRSQSGPTSMIVYGSTLLPPSYVYVTNGNYSLRITWPTAYAADYYRVYRSVNDSVYTRIDTTSSLFYEDTLSESGIWYYRVTSVNDKGESPLSSSGAAAFVRGPAAITCTSGSGSLQLTWNRVQGAVVYQIFRSTADTTGFVACATVTDTMYVDRPARSGTYYYKVRAFTDMYSSYSATVGGMVTAAPLPPVRISSESGVGYIRLTWSPDRTGEMPTSYIIYRSTSSSSLFSPVDTITDTVFVDSIDTLAYFYYRISGVNASGEGQQTGIWSGSSRLPAAPNIISVSNVYGTHVVVQWNTVQGAQSYILYRATSYSGVRQVVDTTSDTSYHDSTCTPGTTCYYWVASIGITGASSTGLYGTGFILPPPLQITAAQTPYHLNVYWTFVSGAQQYRIYRAGSSEGPFSFLDSTATTSYNDTVPDGMTYYYRVASVGANESGLSVISNGAKLSLPSIPEILSVSQGSYDSSISVTWGTSSGANSYLLYRSSDSSLASLVLVSQTTATSLYDTVSSDSVYYYRVKAANQAGQSVLSSAVSGFRMPPTPPSPPESVDEPVSAPDYIHLSWDAPLQSVPFEGYRIYRSTAEAGTYELIDSTTVTTYEDYAPESFPTLYWYKIASFNRIGESEKTAPVSGSRK